MTDNLANRISDNRRHMAEAAKSGRDIELREIDGSTWWVVPHDLVPSVGDMLARVTLLPAATRLENFEDALIESILNDPR